MANELTVSSASLSFEKSGVADDFEVAEKLVNVSGQRYIHHVQLVGTIVEALEIGELGTLGWLLIVNRDATNFVSLRMGAGGADVVKLLAGESARFRLAGNTPHAIANGAACYCDYFLVED